MWYFEFLLHNNYHSQLIFKALPHEKADFEDYLCRQLKLLMSRGTSATQSLDELLYHQLLSLPGNTGTCIISGLHSGLHLMAYTQVPN